MSSIEFCSTNELCGCGNRAAASAISLSPFNGHSRKASDCRNVHWLSVVLTLGLSLAALTTQAAIVPRLDRGDNLTIVAIGTSLTAPGSTWFSRMGTWLGVKYPGKVALYNEAIASSASKYTNTYTSPDSGLDVQLTNALGHNPDAIFIEFATNDAYAPYSITPQMSKDNLQAMIDQINLWATMNYKQVDIVVQTMNNVIDEHATDRPNLATYFDGYRTVALANHVLLIDHYSNWMNLYDSEADHGTWHNYVADGIHPNDLGAEKMIVPEIQRALNSQVPEPTSYVQCAGLLCGLVIKLWQKGKLR